MASERAITFTILMIVCINMVLCSDESSCKRDGKYHFVKRTGYMSITGLPMWKALNITSITSAYCHRVCWESCPCYGYFFIKSEREGLPERYCAFLQRSMPRIEEISSSEDHFYVLTRKAPAPAPATHAPALAPAPAPASPTHAPPIGSNIASKKRWEWRIWVLGASPAAIALSFIALYYYFWIKQAKSSTELHDLTDVTDKEAKSMVYSRTRIRSSSTLSEANKIKKQNKLGGEMQMFKFECISEATNQFSSANKLGEGGFGPVYKGNLGGGEEVAVKRLSTNSSQGIVEFENEIELIAKLQHTNLVRLLGCCIEGNENMLVYEFLANKSLDSFLFDSIKKKLLDWKKRIGIIEGTAQGLLYLHKYSRFKVIHRDLKTSNILLDSEFNPKISDFGLARIFEKNKSTANTRRIIGTYGYMSPEYAMGGIYSEKSDVFSFGVIVLEIMTGKRATSFTGSEHPPNIIRYAWELWREGKGGEVIDESIEERERCGRMEELVRHIQVGLLCVEERPSERPEMFHVLSMLRNKSMPLQIPRQPAFYCGTSQKDVIPNESNNCSPNLVTISPIQPR